MRRVTRGILSEYPDRAVAGAAGDGLQALEVVEQLTPDIAILDLRMPKLNGIEAARSMKKRDPDTKVITLSIHDEEEYIVASREAGASAFLKKTCTTRELVEAVRRVHMEETVYPAGYEVAQEG